MHLKKDDKLVVWAPSSPAPFLFPNRFERALEALKTRGYNIQVGESCKKNITYDLNFAKNLVEEFHQYLLDDEIKGIIFAVGGWTTIALLPYINWNLLKENPKPIIGYSDATALLLAAYKETGQKTFHGPMVISEWGEFNGPWEYSITNFENALFTKNTSFDLLPPKEWTQEVLWWDKEDGRRRLSNGKGEWRIFNHGKCEGILIGGNLNIISLMLGTKYMPSFKDKILFLETEGYSPDKFLAYLMQLQLHNVFNEIKGLIIGRHSNPISSSSGAESFDEILNYFFGKVDIPIMLDVDLGHTEPMVTLPIGGSAVIDTESKLLKVFN
ncbi:hypothetical protein CN285_25015 [Bacillus cereus]|uniref:S66 family peptidase n=1 Tax=Bacillus paramycoides TaxID=2026194 RepID=UPI000BF72AF5|nr:S66 peptidase family protein [Bacillus paramycoides]PFD34739.1 hypothetical protein CN285_25015 [Bacillus cereus]PGM56697.1 hypothetical protein CN947_24195 [Bacillus cereus]